MSTTTESVDLVGDAVVENLARAAVFAALTGAFAYVSFTTPVTPVPVTLQVLGVFLAGIFLGPVWGGVSLGLYLLAGGLGAPVFAGGSAGVGALVGPYGGYLWTYPAAAALVGLGTHGISGLENPADVSLLRVVGGMVVGTLLIYAGGMVGYALVQNVDLERSFGLTVVPFVPAEAFKMAAAIGIARSEELGAA
jgi:biotin transport system substrate-specific component